MRAMNTGGKPWILAIGLIGLVATATASERPNVLFIIIDTLRADHLGAYGYARNTSPVLDSLAGAGVLFEEAIAQASTTTPSVASILSSTYPIRQEARLGKSPFPESARTLAEVLSAAGYRTGGIVANPVLQRRYGFGRGFVDYRDGEDVLRQGAETITQAALDWMINHRAEPFYCWVHYLDPHGRYTPPSPYAERFLGDELDLIYEGIIEPGRRRVVLGKIPRTQWLREEERRGKVRALQDPARDRLARRYTEQLAADGFDPVILEKAYYIDQYDGEIAYNDAEIGRMLGEMRRWGILEHTLVVVTSDHGESLDEHDYYFSHGYHLYDATLHVPLLFALGDRLAQGRRVETQVRGLDVVPTILDLLELPRPESMVGEPLTELVRPEETNWLRRTFRRRHRGGRPAFSFTQVSAQSRSVRSARLDGWKLIQISPFDSGPEELYDLADDPGETRNLIAGGEETARRLRLMLIALAEDLAPDTQADGAMDAQTREMLRSLGYVD